MRIAYFKPQPAILQSKGPCFLLHSLYISYICFTTISAAKVFGIPELSCAPARLEIVSYEHVTPSENFGSAFALPVGSLQVFKLLLTRSVEATCLTLRALGT